MDHLGPEHGRYTDRRIETLRELEAAADERIARAGDERLSGAITGELVAETATLLSDFTPRSPMQINAHLREHGLVGNPLRVAQLEAMLEVAEQVFLDEGIFVVWTKTTEQRRSLYAFEQPPFDGPTVQLLNALRDTQTPITAAMLEQVFGEGLNRLFTRSLNIRTLGTVAGLLRSKYQFPAALIDACIYAFHETGLVEPVSGPRGLACITPTKAIFVDEPAPVAAPVAYTAQIIEMPPTNSSAKEYQKAWEQNPHRELAVVALKRLAWVSAQNGIPITALLSWMDADGVGENMKFSIIASLQQQELIIVSDSERGQIVALHSVLREQTWTQTEAMVRRAFE